MVLPIPPNNPNTPIPNNPFYSPSTTFFCGPYYPALVTPTSGLNVNADGTITVTGGGGGGAVTALTAGPGIALSSSTGNITVCTNIVAGTNIALTQSGNQISISAVGLGTGTVTAISAGNGLCSTSSPITTSGSLSLNANCVIPPNAFNIKGNLLAGTGPGAYTALNPGTDGQVLVSCAGSGAAGLCWGSVGTVTSVTGTLPISVATGTTTPAISIAPASTTGSGAVQLNDTLVSTSTTQALTAAQGKVLKDQIDTLLVAGTIELAGTIDASTGLVASVTSVGTADGYTVGFALPTASSTTNNTYVIVTTPGTMTPPGGSATVATRGDWFLVSETSPGVFAWTFLNVGFDAPAASDTVPGIVELATNAETAAGTDATIAVTPAGLSSAYIAKTALTAKGALVSATAASTPSALAVGTDGQVLVACAAATTGLCWTAPAATGIPCACITAKGSLVSGTAAATPTALPVGTDGDVLVACAAASTGLCWTAPAPSGIPCACVLGKGALITGTAGSTPVGLGVGLDNQVLVACSAAATGLCWTTVPVATPTSQGTVLGRVDLGSGGLGFRALNSLTTGLYNVGIGEDAGCSITSGNRNVAVGPLALCCVTTANDNIGIGVEALRRNTTGTANIAIGTTTLVFNTTGVSNVAIGCDAGRAITEGSGNVLVGAAAGQLGSTLGRSVAIGEFSLQNSGTAQYSTAVGWNALNNASGGCNTAIGGAAGTTITTGTYNLAIGPNVQVASGTASCQLAIGWETNRWLSGDSGKHIQPGAGIRDCTGSLGSAGQVLSSTGAAIQWASAGGAKQYLYALVGNTGSNILAPSTIPLTGISAGGGLSVSFNNVTLTVGKTYLLTASLTNTARASVPIVRWRVNVLGQVGPEIYNEYSQTASSSSWIWSPTPGNEAIQLQLATGQLTLRREASSLTIVEI